MDKSRGERKFSDCNEDIRKERRVVVRNLRYSNEKYSQNRK